MSRYRRTGMGNDKKGQKRDRKKAAKGRCDDVYDDHQCHVVVSLQRRKQQQQEYHSSADHRGSSRGRCTGQPE